MTFPTIPTGGRVLSNVQANTTATRTFPAMSGLTKDSGDLLIAICIAYQTGTGTNAAFSGWSDSFTELATGGDTATSTTMAIGIASKWSTGSETAAPTVTQAGTITGSATMFLLSIPGAHPSTPPEAGGRASGTTGVSTPASFDPTGWGAEDTLWINVAAQGETATGGTFDTMSGTPSNYTNAVIGSISNDAVGGVQGAVAFRQLNASSEDAGSFTKDTTNARDAAIIIAVRPNPNATVTPSVVAATTSIPTPGVNLVNVLASVVAATATVAALTGNIVPNLDARAAIPTPTITDGTTHATATPSVVSAVTSIASPGVSAGDATATPTRVSAVATIPTPAVEAARTWFTVIGDPTTPELIVSSEEWGLLVNGVINNGGDYEQTFDDYFTTREAQGYNAVEVSMFHITDYEGGQNGPDYDNVYPFNTNSTNPSNTRNTAWWDRRDYFFASAAAHGFRVFLNISTAYLGLGAFTASWTTTQWEDWGDHLVAKYPESTHPHVWWIVGDDYFNTENTELDAMLVVMRAGGATQPISIQWYQEATSRYNIYTAAAETGTDWATEAEYNWGYSYNPSYDVVEKMGNESNPIPYGWMDGFFLETGTTGLTDKQLMRRMVWWALSSGSKSIQIGNNLVYPWDVDAYTEVTSNTFYTTVMPAITSAFRTLPNWHRLKADTSSVLVTAGRGTHVTAIVSGGSGTPYTDNSDSYVTASRTPTGDLAVIYMSHGSTITVDESKLVGGYIARWLDPANGTFSSATAGSSYNSTAKGNNSDGQADWVLVLQAASSATATPSVVAAVATVGAPTITSSATVTPSVVAAVASVPSPTVTTSGNANVTPTVVASTTSIPAPTITSRATAAASVVAAVTTVPAPTVRTGSTATATVVTATATVPTPTVTTSGNVNVAASVVTAVATVGSVTITSSATAAATVVPAPATIPTPTITSSATVAPVVVAAAATIPTPSVSTSGNVNVSPTVVAAAATVPAPAVAVGSRVTASAVQAVATVASVTVTSSAAVAPSVVAASTTIPTPTVTTTGNATATPAVVAATATIPPPAAVSGAHFRAEPPRESTIPAETRSPTIAAEDRRPAPPAETRTTNA